MRQFLATLLVTPCGWSQWSKRRKLFDHNMCESGGIGRRAGFRFLWGNPWGFESPLSHLVSVSIVSEQRPVRTDVRISDTVASTVTCARHQSPTLCGQSLRIRRRPFVAAHDAGCRSPNGWHFPRVAIRSDGVGCWCHILRTDALQPEPPSVSPQ